MTDRTEIHTDGTFNDQTVVGGWAVVVTRTATGRESAPSSYEMGLPALVEAVKLADGTSTVVSDYDGLVRTAQAERTPDKCRPLWRDSTRPQRARM